MTAKKLISPLVKAPDMARNSVHSTVSRAWGNSHATLAIFTWFSSVAKTFGASWDQPFHLYSPFSCTQGSGLDYIARGSDLWNQSVDGSPRFWHLVVTA